MRNGEHNCYCPATPTGVCFDQGPNRSEQSSEATASTPNELSQFQTKNISLTYQLNRLGIFSMILCLALGISSFFTLSVMIIIWAAVTL